MNFSEQLRPFTQLLRKRRRELKLTAEEVGALAGFGQTWCTELETGKGTSNPSVRRLTSWTQALGAQEFGVYVVIDGHYTAVPVFETDDEDITEEDASA
jgi:transcriptional regulator with XRE-family HTH domain